MGADVMELKRICKRYGEKQVLRDFSLPLETGKTTCIMGRSGCGKTTLLRIVLGLETADSGERTGFDGVRMSAVFQEDRLLEKLTAEGNLRFVLPDGKAEEIPAILEELGLAGESEAVEQFSGGMKRRVAIARALIADYDLLVLDEPFRGLDAETKTATMETLRRRSAGKAVLLVTHDAAEATMADTVVVME